MSRIDMTFVNGSDDPEVDLAARTLSRLLRERQLARYEAWQENRSSYPQHGGTPHTKANTSSISL